MALGLGASEKLQFLITADADQAVKAFKATGAAAEKELGAAEKRIDKVGRQLTVFGAGALAAAGIAAKGLSILGNAAGDLNETLAATDVIFGDASDSVEKFARNAAKNLGLSTKAAAEGANTFGTFGKSAGLAGEDLAGFSTEMVTLAGDLASFKNTSPEEAILAIGAALRGESEPIRQYGVLLDDATLKQRAMTLGIYEGTAALTPQQKVLAAQAEILAQTSDAQGDFARTSDSLANQQRILSAELDNLKSSLGQGVLPVMQKLTGFATSAAGAFNSLSPAVQGQIGSFAAYATAAIGVVGALSLIAGQAIKLRDRFTVMGDDGERSLTKIGKAAKAAGIGFAAFAALDISVDVINSLTGATDKLTRALEDLQSAKGDEAMRKFLELLASSSVSNAQGALGKVSVNIEDFNDLLRESPAAGKNFIEQLEQMTATTPELAGTVAALRAEYEAYVKTAATIADKQSEVNAEIEGARSSTEGLVGPTDELAEAQQTSADAAKEQAEALELVNEAAQTMLDAFLTLPDAIDEHAEALAELVDVNVQFNKEPTAENLAKVEGAAKKLAAADTALARATAESNGSMFTQKDALDATNSSLLKQAANMQGPAKQAIFDRIAALNGIPDTVISEIKALLDAGDIAGAEARLNSTSRSRDAAIRAEATNVGYTEQQLANLARNRRAIIHVVASPGGTGGLTGGGAAQGGVQRFAQGGVALVGERGPELVGLPDGAHVMSAETIKNVVGKDVAREVRHQVAINLGQLPRRHDRRAQDHIMANIRRYVRSNGQQISGRY